MVYSYQICILIYEHQILNGSLNVNTKYLDITYGFLDNKRFAGKHQSNREYRGRCLMMLNLLQLLLLFSTATILFYHQ